MRYIERKTYTLTIPAGFAPYDGSPENELFVDTFELHGYLYRMDMVLPVDNTQTLQSILLDENDIQILSVGGTNSTSTDPNLQTGVTGFHRIRVYNAGGEAFAEDVEVTFVLTIEE